jgi:hypothetical protein
VTADLVLEQFECLASGNCFDLPRQNHCRSAAGDHIRSWCSGARIFDMKLRIVICTIMRDAVCSMSANDTSTRETGHNALHPGFSALTIVLRTSHTSPLSRSDFVHWHIASVAGRCSDCPKLGARPTYRRRPDRQRMATQPTSPASWQPTLCLQ